MNKRALQAGLFSFVLLWAGSATAADPPAGAASFPRALDTYEDAEGIWATLTGAASAEPFNLVATLIFFLAIVHSFFTSRFMTIAHKWAREHEQKIERGETDRNSVHHGAEAFHFLGEVEAVFGIWAIALVIAIIAFYDWKTAIQYVGHDVNFTEPAFVVVIMTLAATRPILRLAENIITRIAGVFGTSLTAR